MNVIGVDPGLSGAIALLGPFIDGVMVWDMPLLDVIRNNKHRHDVDAGRLYDLFALCVPGVAYVERVGSMPGQGVSSTFAFGRATGIAIGIFAGLGWSVVEVAPQTWKKYFGLVGTEKDASRLKAIELFPGSADEFKRKKDVGRSDAALIAAYGATKVTSGTSDASGTR